MENFLRCIKQHRNICKNTKKIILFFEKRIFAKGDYRNLQKVLYVAWKKCRESFLKTPLCNHGVVPVKFFMHFIEFCKKIMKHQMSSRTFRYPRLGSFENNHRDKAWHRSNTIMYKLIC